MDVSRFGPLPDWAEWLAQDADGAWWAFEAEPNQHDRGWYENEAGRYKFIAKESPNSDWPNAILPCYTAFLPLNLRYAAYD